MFIVSENHVVFNLWRQCDIINLFNMYWLSSHCVPNTGYMYRSWRYGYALSYQEPLVQVEETDRNNACVKTIRRRDLMKKNSGSHETLRENHSRHRTDIHKILKWECPWPLWRITVESKELIEVGKFISWIRRFPNHYSTALTIHVNRERGGEERGWALGGGREAGGGKSASSELIPTACSVSKGNCPQGKCWLETLPASIFWKSAERLKIRNFCLHR